MFKLNQIITVDGKEYRTDGIGVLNEGMRFLALSSTTEFTTQRNGKYPRQICDWVAEEEVAA